MTVTVMAEYATYQRPHRRPVGVAAGQTVTKPQQQTDMPISPTHYHSRTASSAIFAPSAAPQSGYAGQAPAAGIPQQQQQQQQQYIPQQPTRRMTNSTVSSNESNPRNTYSQHPNMGGPAAGGQAGAYGSATNRSSNANLRRSTSARSQASSLGPNSYVALLRKQKATVWCDKTQHVDPRVTAQNNAAKLRAAREILAQSQGRNSIALSGNAATSSSGGMLSSRKKQHAGKGAAGGGGGAGANLAAGVGVPMRLSASEVGDEGSDEDDGVYTGGSGGVHRRTNSGKSSLTGAGGAGGGQSRLSAPRTNTRLSHGSGFSGVSAATSNKPGSGAAITPPGESSGSGPILEHRDSLGSTGSEERREREMGEVGDMLAPSAAETQEAQRTTKEELSRRGSVDERSATMRGAAGAMRLFVANPDADDSD